MTTFSAVSNAQDAPVERGYDFQKGDVVSSDDGTLTGALRKAEADDDHVVAVFAGLNSNKRSEVFRSTGVAEVTFSDVNGAVKRGDRLAPVGNGMVGKALADGVVLGRALNASTGGKVRVQIDIRYENINSK